MNWKIISICNFGICAIIATLINNAAEDYYERAAKQKAIEMISDESQEALDAAKKAIDYHDEIIDRERKEIFNGVRSWKTEHNYDARINDIHQECIDELNEFKTSIDYFNRKQKIQDEYDDAVSVFKESIEYDYETSLLKAEIKDAEDTYKKRCKRIESVSGSDEEISEALNNVKKAEKEKMNKAINGAKGKLSELKTKLSNEEERLNRKKQADLRELEAELQATRTRLGKAEIEASSAINAEKSKFENELRQTIMKKRTDKENEAINSYDDNVKFLEDQRKLRENCANDIYKNAKTHEVWAEWLKAVECPKWLVVFVGALPLVPAGYALHRYVKFVYLTVKAM